MAVKSDNLNLNLNLNLGAAAAGAGAGLGRPRFNTEDFPKTAVLPAVPTAVDDNLAAIPAFSHRPDWDAEGRAWLHLSEFTSALGAGRSGVRSKLGLTAWRFSSTPTHPPFPGIVRLSGARPGHTQISSLLRNSIPRSRALSMRRSIGVIVSRKSSIRPTARARSTTGLACWRSIPRRNRTHIC